MTEKILKIEQKPQRARHLDKNLDLLDFIKLPKSNTVKAIISGGIKTALGTIPVLNNFLQIFETVNQELREEKLRLLLLKFADKFHSIEDGFNQLNKLFQSRSGLILFQKIIHILDNEIPNDEFSGVLANILKNISGSDFEKQFEDHSYTLGQIDKMSPHSLLLLSKFDSWNKIKFSGATTMSGQTIIGDWDTQIANYFCGSVSVTDASLKERIRHAFKDLEIRGVIKISEEKGVFLTQVGEEIHKYIS